jgi:hypothetical protein
MQKTNKTKIAHIITIICVSLSGVLFHHIFSKGAWEINFSGASAGGTRFKFDIDGGGFDRGVTIYTENGITSVDFSGRITVRGTADIYITSNESGSIVYSETYTNTNAQKIDFKVSGLEPYSYYTLRFSSGDAEKGQLTLTTNQSLVEQYQKLPQRPERSNRIDK